MSKVQKLSNAGVERVQGALSRARSRALNGEQAAAELGYRGCETPITRLVGMERDLGEIAQQFSKFITCDGRQRASVSVAWAIKYYWCELQPGRDETPYVYLPRTPKQFYEERT